MFSSIMLHHSSSPPSSDEWVLLDLPAAANGDLLIRNDGTVVVARCARTGGPYVVNGVSFATTSAAAFGLIFTGTSTNGSIYTGLNVGGAFGNMLDSVHFESSSMGLTPIVTLPTIAGRRYAFQYIACLQTGTTTTEGLTLSLDGYTTPEYLRGDGFIAELEFTASVNDLTLSYTPTPPGDGVIGNAYQLREL